MSFRSTDLVSDVVFTWRLSRYPQFGLVLCGQATAAAEDEEEDDLECGQVTAPPDDEQDYRIGQHLTTDEVTVSRRENELALLHHQLRQILSAVE
jgi:hypothetical protein